MSDADADLGACAELLSRGDPERFRAAMAAPVAARRVLLPLYAFNLEVARAPWVTKEPMIAEMRLQWWRDALDEIAQGGRVRRHEVVTPLAAILDPRGARDLDGLIDARRQDLEGAPTSRDALMRYIDRTAGALMWTSARLLGASDAPASRDAGKAHGIVAWLAAAPELSRRNRRPIPPDTDAEDLAREGLAALDRFTSARLPRSARPATYVLADARARLRALADGRDMTAPSAWRLMRTVVTGRV